MAEVRLTISDDLLEKLRKELGDNAKATDIAREAVALFNWAVSERAKGRVILSSDEPGEKISRLTMPYLERAAKAG